MAESNAINISKCDNQLILLAYTWNGCYEICNIKSGNNNAVSVDLNFAAGEFNGTFEQDGVNGPINAQHTVNLPAGTYTLDYVGINWGGPYDFEFTFQGNTYSLPNDPSKPLDGVVWALGNESLKITV